VHTFVDIGGGDGFISKELENAGYETILFDPNIVKIACAKNRNVKNLVCGYFTDNTVKVGSVQAIGLFDVLEHIENDGEFIRELSPLLAEKGKIIITVPAHNYLWSAKDDGGHYRRYSLPQLKQLFMQNGFDVLYATYFFSLLLPAIYFLKALPYRYRKKCKRKEQNSASAEKKHEVFRKEHQKRGAGFLLRMLKYEQAFIRRGKRIPFGASVLLVGQKR
jgi:2-polyprenyl-3-methyl-5-hydroxy-6-metoxy-1,4-benzoquinol methylase